MIMRLARIVIEYLNSLIDQLRMYKYRSKIPAKVRRMRQKEKIKVLFVLSDLSLWKSEALYRAMLEHPRFDPVLGVCLLEADKPTEIIRKFNRLCVYLKDKKYEYVEISQKDIATEVNPDIIFYQQPYPGIIAPALFFRFNLQALFCHTSYAFNTTQMPWEGTMPYFHYCWHHYFENKSTKETRDRLMPRFIRNGVVTGVPVQDTLASLSKTERNPWKNGADRRKRIIWAPHHTISDGLLHYSTFLEIADDMVALAEKYKEEVWFSFKPHPFLYKRLVNEWGMGRTEAYYAKWAQMENTQYDSGDYLGLFAYSDAMIHDCGSFTVEYLYTGNPVMYLVNGLPHTETLNDFGKAAYEVHYMGHTIEEIETFIRNVLQGKDDMKEKRAAFVEEYLTLPDGKTACRNIMDAILYGE